ncbi:MAG: acyl carrier protein [Bacteroidales bacterium]
MEVDTIQIKEKIKNYILDVTGVDGSKIQDETLIFKEGYFDSMGFVLLITFLEENFGISTADSDLVEENFESISAMTDFVIRKSS